MNASMKCCVEHLARTGRGVVGSDGDLIVNACHCDDGDRARCKTCRKVWEYVEDEAEGSRWECRSKGKAGA